MKTTKSSDITIVGAGPTGLLSAISLSEGSRKIYLLDQNGQISIANPKEDGRAVALNRKTVSYFQDIGIWDQIDEKHKFPILNAAVFDGDSSFHLSFGDKSVKPLGYFIKNSILRKLLYEKVTQDQHIEIQYGKTVRSVVKNSHRNIVIECNDVNFEQPLLIAADGRFSHLRNFTHISYSQKDFNRLMFLVEVKHKQSHYNKAIEQFMYNGITCAILPLSDYYSSIALSVSKTQADLFNQDRIFKTIDECVERHIGKIQEIFSSHAYPLISTYAHLFFNRSLVLIGDAAIGMHPVTAHGFNLAVYGIKTLADQINQTDINNILKKKIALLKYQTLLKLNAKPLYEITNAIVSAYTNDANQLLRKGILLAVDKLPLWKDLVYAKMGAKNIPSSSLRKHYINNIHR
jgi:ubiquinone biosynthesis UbiH/UbiF/VisC/COQ6 family hydroxylase